MGVENLASGDMATTDGSSAAYPPLSEFELAILEFERRWWQYAGAKESSIRELFKLTPTKYYEILNDLIDHEAALAASPILVKRLRRMRAARLAERQGRR